MDQAPDAGQLGDDADAVDTRPLALGHQNTEHHGHNRHDQYKHPHTISISIQSNPELVPYTDSDLGNRRDDGLVYHDSLAVGPAQANIPDSFSAAYHDAPALTTEDHHEPPHSIDPHNFYKNYWGLDASTGPDLLPMATTSSSRPSLRSNSDGTTPRHPAVPSPSSLPRDTLRAVSSPLDAKLSTRHAPRTMASGKPSVQDLKRRFDQNPTAIVPNPTIPPAASRLAVTSRPSRPRNGALEHGSPHGAGDADMHQSPASGGTIGVLGSSSLPRRQPIDDNSSQSFASRIGKPRKNNTEAEVAPASQPNHQVPSVSTGDGQSRRLLFGEVMPDHQDVSASVGFGIDGARTRRTSESSISHPKTHNRTFSGPSGTPPSPNAWYRDPASRPDDGFDGSPSQSRHQRRSRAHSDAGSSSPSSQVARNTGSRPSAQSSKLPVSVRKLNTPSSSTSPSSTRSSSPSTLKRYQVNGRPATRRSPVATRAKTPTQNRKPPTQGPPMASSNSNTRLQAYISAPAQKLSPTLRSSRPRQPVSIATTASSRMRETDKPKLAKSGESTSRRPKLSIGPIDFEQRREHIRLAYTKSIRASKALEARTNDDTEQERQDQRTTTAAQQATEHNAPEIIKSENSALLSSETIGAVDGDSSQDRKSGVSGAPDAADSAMPSAIPPLTVSTDIDTTSVAPDSPTLGLPGSFPDQTPPMPIAADEPPDSAVSAASDTTEFDAEPQTYPPVQAHSPLAPSPGAAGLPSPQRKQGSSHPRSEYRYPFDDDVDSPTRAPKTKDPAELPASDVDDVSSVPSSLAGNRKVVEGLGISSSELQDTVIILPPAAQGTAYSANTQTTPFPRLQPHYDSECQSDSDQITGQSNQDRHEDDAVTDFCTEETDDREQADVLAGHFHGDHVPSYRTSTCASSEVGAYDDSSYEQQQHIEASSSNNLLTPNSRYREDRFSRQSAWTDFSVDSADRYVYLKFQNSSETRDSGNSRRSSNHYSSHHLPEVDTGNGFSVPYLSHRTGEDVSYVPSPIHEPPPVPTSLPGSGFNSRTSSTFYDQTQYESTLLNSERESDEYMSHAGTSRSVDSTSLATTDQYVSAQTPAESDTKSLAQDGDELSDKERHRLGQRRNVIKELVDTEAVFVRDMNIVEEIYKGTAEACPKLDGKTIKLIFRNSDEIITFHTTFLAEIKEAVADVYIPKGPRTMPQDDSSVSTSSFTAPGEPNDAKDRSTSLGTVFKNNIEQLKVAHEGFLRASDQAAKRLIQIQQDPTVQVWLNECNEVAKDLTAAWDLDSLLIKPMQRITKYPYLIISLLQHTPRDHPDRDALLEAKAALETAIIEINKTKKNFELVGQIVGRKRKESDVKAGFARAFGKRVDKMQASSTRSTEDADYAKLNEKFGDDYLRLQVVLRDVEFYTRQVSAYVHEFLQYMSSIELVMRLQPGNYPELESKWVQFNISVRDLEKVALDDHLAQVRKHVIEPFEHVIKAYGNPSLAMKKRQKRRVDYERLEQLKRSGKSPDPKLKELVEQYEALNDTLKKELPQLSALTEKVGNICLGNFVNIQANWYAIWKDKMKAVLQDCGDMPDLQEVVSTFQQDFPYASDQMAQFGILNPATWGRTSLSTNVSVDDGSVRTRGRPSDVETRSRGQSVNDDVVPSLPTPDFGGRGSGSFAMSPPHNVTSFGNGNVPTPHQYYYRDYYAGIHLNQGGSSSPKSPEVASNQRSAAAAAGMTSTRPSTGRSYDSGMVRQSSDSAVQQHRDSSATYSSTTHVTQETQREPQRFSNLFHSALPMSDGPDEGSSQRPSRASSRERSQTSDGYNVLWLAASLFEFNISATKHEAGYPYLTYQAGEIFDVIAEKGELWLAKNQDDGSDQVGWIWSKHFAKLADS